MDLLCAVPSVPGGTVALAGPDRPVRSGSTVGLDVTATDLSAGETIVSYAWSVQSGGGSLAGATTATPTYTAPSGSGVAVVRASVTTSAGRSGNLDLRVSRGPNPVAAENTLPGAARATWDLPVGALGGVSTLQGFADGFSFDHSATPLWRHTSVAALTAGQAWSSPAQILGFEWDTYGPAGTSSPGAAYLAPPHPDAVFCSHVMYPIPSGLLLTGPGDEYDSAGTATHRLVVHPGGAGSVTFGTGTINWSLGLDSANTYQVGGDNTSTVIRQATINILADMGVTAATLMSGLTAPTRVHWWGPSAP
ncbi:hypothetical protein GCM10011608_24740 [Micromonospora sonchi]|uniref:N,N-dimethylformamidase beta subunit-like C-terminal domain-containing protein n=1 Tax=Micromonospora sonchi TaxID=1763543 RepID=A0A917TUM6_9ACTN|nr:N,N-dimethylformamidase beta subunit family domain-containing protein [Micromonospora sonchi]GGM39086.1 hypothetical protein GCM10011608_24740 [Micromonospora sonchi]